MLQLPPWAHGAEYNFDVPEAFDEETIIDCLTALKVRSWWG